MRLLACVALLLTSCVAECPQLSDKLSVIRIEVDRIMPDERCERELASVKEELARAYQASYQPTVCYYEEDYE
jgi:hypothetical protein